MTSRSAWLHICKVLNSFNPKSKLVAVDPFMRDDISKMIYCKDENITLIQYYFHDFQNIIKPISKQKDLDLIITNPPFLKIQTSLMALLPINKPICILFPESLIKNLSLILNKTNDCFIVIPHKKYQFNTLDKCTFNTYWVMINMNKLLFFKMHVNCVISGYKNKEYELIKYNIYLFRMRLKQITSINKIKTKKVNKDNMIMNLNINNPENEWHPVPIPIPNHKQIINDFDLKMRCLQPWPDQWQNINTEHNTDPEEVQRRYHEWWADERRDNKNNNNN